MQIRIITVRVNAVRSTSLGVNIRSNPLARCCSPGTRASPRLKRIGGSYLRTSRIPVSSWAVPTSYSDIVYSTGWDHLFPTASCSEAVAISLHLHKSISSFPCLDRAETALLVLRCRTCRRNKQLQITLLRFDEKLWYWLSRMARNDEARSARWNVAGDGPATAQLFKILDFLPWDDNHPKKVRLFLIRVTFKSHTNLLI